MRFKIHDIRFYVLPMRTRFPFKYGIASMNALPHLVAVLEMEVDGRKARGMASEGLPPKWFTKNPETPFELDLAEMLAVIQNASRLARLASASMPDYFRWWQELYQEQSRWAAVRSQPALLANLGVSLMERAVLDGLCKAGEMNLHSLLGSERLGIRLGEVRPELQGMNVADVLERSPLPQVAVRHTVGLGDPLRAADIPADERLEDGLPHALDESIAAYGLTFFKIKLSGKAEADLPRLREITSILVSLCPDGFQATLDGNEQFVELGAFREFYQELQGDLALAPLLQSLLFIEQPLHRDHALKDDVAACLAGWQDSPGVIIDEADGGLQDLPRALDLGYLGTSHKNCKGIVKGLANAALLKARVAPGGRPGILSGEDLANVGPVALLQDLAMVAALGIRHVERNGQHYFKGLSMHPKPVQEAVLEKHADLYRRHPQGFPTLNIHQGHLRLDSVNAAPFGCVVELEDPAYLPLNDWIKQGGMAEL